MGADRLRPAPRRARAVRTTGLALLAILAGLAAGCGAASPRSGAGGATPQSIPAALAREARPIGHGARFHPPARGPVIGPCRPVLGARSAAHVELFAADRVMLVAAGIGTRPPRRRNEGRISSASCYGAVVTLDPTGVVLTRRGSRATVADLFRSWGEPLTRARLASFRGRRVEVFVDGRRRPGPPGTVPLSRHAEIVLEIGPHVPPHPAYNFPPGE